jgi:hypothetical protein
MDATINPVSGASPQYPPPAAKTATGSAPSDTQAQAAAVQQAPPPPSADNTPTPSVSIAAQHEATMRQAALSFKNVYPLGDQEFSIFKDATGKYITRYVSLRDGKVTYMPEPTLVKQLQLGTGSSGPVRVAISA